LGDNVLVEKESWWLYALLLAALGLLVLFFHLYRSELKWGVTGSQQGVELISPTEP
jgi:hypothetical protein